jgi:hypothetical protein
MCLQLALVLIGFFSFLFLLQLLTVRMKQTRQMVRAIKQSILLRCLWLYVNGCKEFCVAAAAHRCQISLLIFQSQEAIDTRFKICGGAKQRNGVDLGPIP